MTDTTREAVALIEELRAEAFEVRELYEQDHPHAGLMERAANALAALRFAQDAEGWNLVAHLHRQRAFSEKTFGPGTRIKGVLDHIRKELGEIERAPDDVEEWADLLLLSLDGAWRQGHTPEAICAAIEAKQTKNEGRKWPDWRTMSADKAIEHDRTEDAASPPRTLEGK